MLGSPQAIKPIAYESIFAGRGSHWATDIPEVEFLENSSHFEKEYLDSPLPVSLEPRFVEEPLRILGFPVMKKRLLNPPLSSHMKPSYPRYTIFQGRLCCDWGRVVQSDVDGVFCVSVISDSGNSGGPALDTQGGGLSVCVYLYEYIYM